MRYEYIEPVVNSTIGVLDSVLQSDISKGEISLVREGGDYDGLTIVVTVRGDSDGSIFLNMEQETALNICGIMSGADCEKLGSEALDCISELANMVAGNVTSLFNDMGFDYKVSTPMVLDRRDIPRNVPNLEVFQVPLFTECGEITVNVTLGTN